MPDRFRACRRATGESWRRATRSSTRRATRATRRSRRRSCPKPATRTGSVGACGEQLLDRDEPEEAVAIAHGDVDGALESLPEKRPAKITRGVGVGRDRDAQGCVGARDLDCRTRLLNRRHRQPPPSPQVRELLLRRLAPTAVAGGRSNRPSRCRWPPGTRRSRCQAWGRSARRRSDRRGRSGVTGPSPGP